MEKTIELMELIYENALDSIIIVDEDQRIRFSTPSFRKLFGLTEEEVSNMNAFDIIHPEDREDLMHKHKILLENQYTNSSQYRIVDRNGQIRHCECATRPIENNLTVVTIRDFTERKNMEAELLYTKERYEELQTSLKSFSQDLSSVTKLSDLKIRLISELLKILPGSEPSIQLLNKHTQLFQENNLSFLPINGSELSVSKIIKIDDYLLINIGERMENGYILALKSRAVKESMEEVWLESLVYYASMVFERLNVIENLMNQLQSSVQKKEAPLWVLRLLFNLSEKQRSNLSADLHETVLDEQLNLHKELKMLLTQKELGIELEEELRSIEHGLLDTIEQIKMTCNELRPPMIREIGLNQSLKELFDYTQKTSSFNIHFDTKSISSHSLNEEQTIGMYRVVQELLNNASKHSKATNIHIHLDWLDDEALFKYQDDGVGFDYNQYRPTFNNLGLTGMKQRIDSLRGTFEFYSEINKGVKIEIRIPYN